MTASVFDSPMFTQLYPVGEAGRLFTHSAEIRAALLVLGTLAKAQGEAGAIPEDSAFFIHRSAMEVQIDPAGLAQGVAQDGSYVPALAAAFYKAMEAPEHSAYLLHNARPQDIADTALMLRLRQLLGLAEPALTAVSSSAETSEVLAALPILKQTTLRVAFDSDPDIGAVVAEGLKLGPPSQSRDHVRAIANWLTLAGTEASRVLSAPTVAALHHQVLGLNTLLQESADQPHAAQSETLLLPQIALGTMALLDAATRHTS